MRRIFLTINNIPGAVARSGKWRVKPSAKLPIFLRFMINSSFTLPNAEKAYIRTALSNRVFLNHMMYWKAEEYDAFEKEVIDHMASDDGWFEKYCAHELEKSEQLYKKGLELKKIDWLKKTNEEMAKILEELLQEYRELACPWYVQYPLDEYFEEALEKKLAEYIPANDQNFRKYVLIFADPEAMTEVSEERYQMATMAKEFAEKKENLEHLSEEAIKRINKHLDKFAYINRGLATSKPYNFTDIINRLIELTAQVKEGKNYDNLILEASGKKVEDDYRKTLEIIKPKSDFQHIIDQTRHHSYLRNRRVEAFFNADYGAGFMYNEIAKRANFNPDWIMEVTVPEMFNFLKGIPLPSEEEMNKRLKNYAMVVRDSETMLVTDPAEMEKLETEYYVNVVQAEEVKGKMACLGGIIRGRAKICLDKSEIGKVERGDILVAQFTTPDFVPAMEKAAAIVADQGGLSSHAAIVSRELGVPCVIATGNGSRVIHDNDWLEIDAQKGTVKIIKRADGN